MTKVYYLRSNISEYIVNCINEINDGDEFKSIELPLGYFFGRNYFLSNGIKVPIKLEVIGYQDVFIEKKLETIGLKYNRIRNQLGCWTKYKKCYSFSNC